MATIQVRQLREAFPDKDIQGAAAALQPPSACRRSLPHALPVDGGLDASTVAPPCFKPQTPTLTRLKVVAAAAAGANVIVAGAPPQPVLKTLNPFQMLHKATVAGSSVFGAKDRCGSFPCGVGHHP